MYRLMSGSRKVLYKGKIYKNLTELTRELGVNYDSVLRRLKEGETLEDAVKPGRRRKKVNTIEYKGGTYESLKELVNKKGVKYATVMGRLRDEIPLDMALKKGRVIRGSGVTYKGKKYASLNELIKKLKISYTVVKTQLDKGMSLEEAVETANKVRRKGLLYNGKYYISLRKLSEKIGINYATLYGRLKKGISLEKVVELGVLEKSKTKEIEYKGIHYDSLRSLATELSIKYNELIERLGRDYTLEEAVYRSIYFPFKVKEPIIYKDIEFATLTDLAKAVNINPSTLSSRVKSRGSVEEALKGWDVELLSELKTNISYNEDDKSNEAEKTNGIRKRSKYTSRVRYKYQGSIIYKGKEYESLKVLAEELGVNYAQVVRRARRGEDVEAIIDSIKARRIKVWYNNKPYKTYKELADVMGINYTTLIGNLRRGATIEEAVKVGLIQKSKKQTNK